MTSRLAAAGPWLRERGAGIGLEILVNGVAPFVLYTATDKQLGDVGALIASSVPPILWSLYQFVRHRTVDALSILVLAGIVMSLLALMGGGGAKFLQLRENLVTGAIGAVFLGSVLIGKPIIFYLARANMRRSASAELENFVGLQANAGFQRVMRVMTLVWGLGLIARTAIAAVLVFTVPIPTYLVLHPILGYGSAGLLIGWTVLYGRRQQRLGDARRAAEAAAAQAGEAPTDTGLAAT